jgi:hypothetical protein
MNTVTAKAAATALDAEGSRRMSQFAVHGRNSLHDPDTGGPYDERDRQTHPPVRVPAH